MLREISGNRLREIKLKYASQNKVEIYCVRYVEIGLETR
jgi:hypothetical protein